MREIIIRKASSTTVAFIGILLLLVFIAAQKKPGLKKVDELPKKKYTMLSLGDSYTIGEKVDAQDNFPNQTVALLRDKGYDFLPPVIIAKTGWTTDELQGAIRNTSLKRKYDFVTLLIGVNNQYRGRTVVEYIPQFEALLKQAIKYCGNRTSNVIVLSIPDWGATPFATDRDREQIKQQIDEFNAANKLLSDRLKVNYIDITPGSRKAADDSSLVAQDGLHPSGKEYGKWAHEIFDVIKKEL